MHGMRNVANVVNQQLCNFCGACMAVCPTDAISFQETTAGLYEPRITESGCSSCTLCLRVCPGIHFGKSLMHDMPDDPFAGHVITCWVGKATDSMIFDRSQSGGAASAVLISALEAREIEAGLVVVMVEGNPPRPEIKWAFSKDEVLEAQKSKYCPIPILSGLKKLKDLGGPIAVVGLPCHFHGLMNMLDQQPGLQRLVKYRIGLICERIMSFAALDYLVHKAMPNDLSKMIQFKDKSCGGYPGPVHIKSSNGESCILPERTRMRIKDYFTPARCRLCFDRMNVFSDLTVGDPHGLDNVDRQMGESIVVVRTAKAQRLLRELLRNGKLNLRRVDYARVLEGQGISEKRRQWSGYSQAWLKLGRAMPDYYGRVKAYAPQVSADEFARRLGWALATEGFPSRKALIHFVDRELSSEDLAREAASSSSLLNKMRLLDRPGAALRRAREAIKREWSDRTLRGTTVEIRGIWFVNKGSELMLLAILDYLGRSLNDVNFVMSPHDIAAPFQKRSRHGLYQKMEFKGTRPVFSFLGRLVPNSARRKYGLVADNEVDVVLDASGFGYTDQWGPWYTLEAARKVKLWRRLGKKVIFLPQAFGPFRSREIRSAFQIIADNADMIYPRDEVSYGHLIDLVGERLNIRMAPDFTTVLEGKIPDCFDSTRNRFALVPNYRMIDKTSGPDSRNYLSFMVRCTRYLLEKSAKPFILIHEGEQDLGLARQIAESAGSYIDVIHDPDVLHTKGILGSCDGVISSRFHGLVSALSQGVPALATGWSHKYQMLMKDYEFPEGMLTITADDYLLRNKIDLILEVATRQDLVSRLKGAGEKQKGLARSMWDEVTDVIFSTK